MAMSDAQTWQRWNAELDFAEKDTHYKNWLNKSAKIVKRYRDERPDAIDVTRRRLNILWSNVQTLLPAVFARAPKPIVERRFMDRDPAARLASTILERCLSTQIDHGDFYTSVSLAVLDHLLPGMGQAWVRYEPQFEPTEEAAANAQVEADEKTAEQVEQEGDGEVYEKVAYERVCVDYVYYADFRWGPARFWREVPWVARRCWLTWSEIAEKFYKGTPDPMAEAKKINLDYAPETMRQNKAGDDPTIGYFKKAEIWEIWNKPDQTVYFIACGTPDIVLKQEKQPVLKLEGFWPCPPPLCATQTNDTIVPVPDYIEYQDQAAELDDLTNRIAALTTALKVAGVYDASVKELARLLQDGQDNKLIPVDQWAAFAEKGGIPGAMSLVPLKEIADTLLGLYQARAQVKNDLFEVTGMSDIVRGQSEGAQKTATEQRIKGQFASMRLEDRRGRVNGFCRSIIRIMAEIVSEMFSAESLMQMSGVQQEIEDKVRKAVEQVPPPPPPPQQGPDGQPVPPQVAQQQQAMAAQAFEQAKAQASQAVMQKEMAEFQKAVQILKSDKLRGFRVDIETDSTIATDAQGDKEAAVELLTGTMQGLTAAGPIVQSAPELMQPIGELLMFAYRKFRVGRSVESSLEDALDKLNDRVEAAKKQPPQPSPEEQAAQADMALMQAKGKQEADKAQMEMQQEQQRFMLEMQQAQADMKAKQEETAMELTKMREELQLEREKMALERDQMITKAAIDSATAERDMMVTERKNELAMETAEQKAKQASKANNSSTK